MSGRGIGAIVVTALAVVAAVTAGMLRDAGGAGQPVAEVDGDVITADEVEQAIRPQLSKLEEQIYALKRQRVEALIRDRLLTQEAKRRGISVQALLDREVIPHVTLVTEEEVDRFYQANKARLKADEPEVREQIRAALQNQKVAAKRDEFVQSLRTKSTVVVHLEPPPVRRVEVPIEGAPAKGSPTAPVTIVEFSDFHCPFCRRVLATLDQITTRYGDRVRLVFRDYPIDQLHPDARRAHEAARCAHEQGKFWAYHDVLFEAAPRASVDELKAYAKQVGLDEAAFDTCLQSRKYAAVVQKDIEEGARLGVNGTPAFFVNGRLVSGAQPLEAFVQVIEDELRRSSAKK